MVRTSVDTHGWADLGTLVARGCGRSAPGTAASRRRAAPRRSHPAGRGAVGGDQGHPARPRPRRNASHPAPSSELATSMPRTSACPRPVLLGSRLHNRSSSTAPAASRAVAPWCSAAAGILRRSTPCWTPGRLSRRPSIGRWRAVLCAERLVRTPAGLSLAPESSSVVMTCCMTRQTGADRHRAAARVAGGPPPEPTGHRWKPLAVTARAHRIPAVCVQPMVRRAREGRTSPAAAPTSATR